MGNSDGFLVLHRTVSVVTLSFYSICIKKIHQSNSYIIQKFDKMINKIKTTIIMYHPAPHGKSEVFIRKYIIIYNLL